MSDSVLDYVSWLGEFPLSPFQEKLDSLIPEELEGTDRYELVLMRFRMLIGDLLVMYRLIGQIIRRLDRDFINLQKKDYTPKSEPEDDMFYVLSLINLDFISYLLFSRILMDKVARLLYSVTKGERPSINRFVDWKKKISKEQRIVPSELKELIINTPWFDELKDVRDDYVVHNGYALHGISNWDTIILRSITNNSEIKYDITRIQNMCDDISGFLEKLNNYLCVNFEKLPIKIE